MKHQWKTKLSVCAVLISGFISGNNVLASELNCDTTLYYCASPETYDVVNITTNTAGKTSPLGGFGVYLNNNANKLKEVNIITSASAADAIRINSEASYFVADKLTIVATGSSADGLNVASDFNNNSDSWVYVKEAANISVKDGVAVRANVYRNAGARSFVFLPDNSVIKVVGTAAASNTSDSKGYAVYAGNRNSDTNGLGIGDILAGKNNNTLGRAYVFIGNDAEISTTTSAGHAVYANKSGIIQLGDGADISTTGNNALAIYAATEQQGTYTDNVRPGHVYLAGGATLRAANSDDVIRANGMGSIISSQYLATPVILDTMQRWERVDIQDDVLTDSEGVFDIAGNINAINGGTVALNLIDTSVINGSTSVDATSIVNLNIKGADSVWNMERDSVLTNLTLNEARLQYVAPAVGTTPDTFVPKTLTVVGDYAGSNGVLALNTVLNDDSSLTDKLIVNGNTSGHTNVVINNIGGEGALTSRGIEIVEVVGDSVGTFGNGQRIVASAFDYFVRSGGTIAGAEAKNWYLISDYSPVDPGPDPAPEPTPDPDPDPGPGIVNPDPAPEPEPEPEIEQPTTPVYRPEAGSYLANMAAANTMFITRLHDRLGETQYTDALTGEKKVTSMWMRHVGGHNRFHDSSGQLKTTSNRYVMQMGGDLAQWSTDGLDRWHVGLMAGYANNSNHTRSKVTGYSSKGEVDGYSVGLYGTWYANNEDKTGTYIDTWMLYNWFDNEVNGHQLKKETYQSRGITASIEGGYTFKLGESERASYWLQPKAQVIWMGVSANDFRENNGTRVKFDNDNNLLTRLGVRTYANGHSQLDDGKNREFEPFIELNWIHNTSDYAVVMNDVKNKQKGTKDLGEVKLGIEGKLNNNLTSWVNVGHQFGSHSYTDTQGMIGVKYSF